MFYIESNTGKCIDVPGHRGVKYWKLRTPEAVARRRKYKANKPKKPRIRCPVCFKRFTPKRSTKRFCSDACRKKHNRDEWKAFERFGFINEWYRLPLEIRQRNTQLQFLRGERYKKLMGLRP
jgi:predicted nucleic acid-binding Zn ribbon protein